MRQQAHQKLPYSTTNKLAEKYFLTISVLTPFFTFQFYQSYILAEIDSTAGTTTTLMVLPVFEYNIFYVQQQDDKGAQE